MLFSQYTAETISGHMSLRKPQKESLAILDAVTDAVLLRKGMNLQAALGAVHAMYPICTDFEREFLSLTFALATGVGKTRLMGAFIAYLYTQRNIRNRVCRDAAIKDMPVTAVYNFPGIEVICSSFGDIVNEDIRINQCIQCHTFPPAIQQALSFRPGRESGESTVPAV